MPRLSDDDVLDFQVKEAMRAAFGKAQEEAAKEQERKDFRGSHRDMARRG